MSTRVLMGSACWPECVWTEAKDGSVPPTISVEVDGGSSHVVSDDDGTDMVGTSGT